MGPSSPIIEDAWKLFYYYPDQQFELFNISDDLGEGTNLAEDFSEQVTIMAGHLSDYLLEVNALMVRDESTGELVPYPIEILRK